MTGFRALSEALARGFMRDKAALFFTIMFPLILLVLFGGVFGGSRIPRSNVVLVGRVAVYDSVAAPDRANLNHVLSVTRTHDLRTALARVHDGTDVAAIVQHGTHVAVYYSNANQTSALTVQDVVKSLVNASSIASSHQAPRLSLRLSQVDGQPEKEIQYLTPGILGWAVATGATFAAATTLVVWRQRKLLRRLILTPVSVPAVIGARIVVSLGVALVQTALFVFVAGLFFHLKLAGSWWMAIPLVLAGTLAFLSIGLLVGAITKSVEAATALANLIVLPMAFLSGSFIPLNNAPSWLQTVSEVLPLRYFNDAMLKELTGGDGPTAVLGQLGILLGFALVLAVAATRLLRWDDA